MDSESLKSLGWLLLWGAAFFAMMRFGRGAHMARDPVCGMELDPRSAAAALVHRGQTFH